MGYVIARVIAAAMLFWALDRHKYDYFVLLRWVTCAVAAYGAVLASEVRRISWTWTLGIVALLFNPILPVHLKRETWAVIDVATGVLLLASIWQVRRLPGKTP